MNEKTPTRRTLIEAEQTVFDGSPHGRIRLGLGYPNTYRVALSSLSHQWVTRLASRQPDVGVDRFYSVDDRGGRTFVLQTPLRDLDILAFTCSFEPDASNLLKILRQSGIPLLRKERSHRDPLVVVGGPVASINPLPLSPAVDVFGLGAAEVLLGRVIEAVKDEPHRDRLLETLADLDGFFIPEHHLDGEGRPRRRIRRLEKRDQHMAAPDLVPASHIVTPHTEYAGRGLIEISRGCPEKCRYCWVSFNVGRLRCYRTEDIIDRIDRFTPVTRRIGLVATAVGDHPDLPAILEHCRDRDLDVALSSLRIPAMVPEVLEPLAHCGARSITIAPETGSDSLRRSMNKPITNERILEAVDHAQKAGIENLKMYFILGLPGETDDHILDIAHLLHSCRDLMTGHGRARGRLGTLSAGLSILVPKPYTPYRTTAMASPSDIKRKIRMLRKATRALSNVRIDVPSYREALWQGYLSRGSSVAFEALEQYSLGSSVASILADRRDVVERVTTDPDPDVSWTSFITSAPVRQDPSEASNGR